MCWLDAGRSYIFSLETILKAFPATLFVRIHIYDHIVCAISSRTFLSPFNSIGRYCGSRKGHFWEGENWVFPVIFHVSRACVNSGSSLLIWNGKRRADGIKTNNFSVFHAGLGLLIMIYAHIFQSMEFHSFFCCCIVSVDRLHSLRKCSSPRCKSKYSVQWGISIVFLGFFHSVVRLPSKLIATSFFFSR